MSNGNHFLKQYSTVYVLNPNVHTDPVDSIFPSSSAFVEVKAIVFFTNPEVENKAEKVWNFFGSYQTGAGDKQKRREQSEVCGGIIVWPESSWQVFQVHKPGRKNSIRFDSGKNGGRLFPNLGNRGIPI